MNALFPGEVVIERCDPDDASPELLYAGERAHIAQAIDKRQRHFAAGRIAARRALERLGIRDFPLLAGTEREPLWPPGISGSISHTEGFGVAVVARTGAIVALGVDVEADDALKPDLWRMILTDDEKEWLRASVGEADRGAVAKLLFCAKEAIYKCHRGAGGGWLGFHDAVVTPDLGTATLVIVANSGERGIGRSDTHLEARFSRADGLWRAGVTLLSGGR